MRFLVFLLITGTIAIGGYTAYEISVMDTPRPAPLILEDPDLAQAKEKALEMQRDLEGSTGQVQLTPELETRKKELVKRLADARALYEDYASQLPPPARILMQRIADLSRSPSKFPAIFLNVPRAENAQTRYYESLSLDPGNEVILKKREEPLLCDEIEDQSLEVDPANYTILVQEDGRREYACVEGKQCPEYMTYDVMIGDPEDNVFICDPAMDEISGDQLYLGGPGNDTIRDVGGDKVVLAGSGDDTLELGWGRKILFFDQGWGRDIVRGNCINAAVRQEDLPEESPMIWPFRFANFVVFGPNISPGDLKWENKTLIHMPSGDSIEFDNVCYNFVFESEASPVSEIRPGDKSGGKAQSNVGHL